MSLKKIACKNSFSVSSSLSFNNSEYFTYNSNGSPLTLKRYGKYKIYSHSDYDLINNLSFTYSGNQLQSIGNTGAYPQYVSPYVFHKNTSYGSNYAYNSNDSMTRNPDRHIIDSQYMTTINITNNSSEVIIGSATTATIDIGDIKAMNGLKNSSTVAALMHETNEQSFLQNPNFRANDKYRMIRAHSAAEGLEHSYTGNIDVTNVLNINTNNSGLLEFHRNNRVIERIKIINGNF